MRHAKLSHDVPLARFACSVSIRSRSKISVWRGPSTTSSSFLTLSGSALAPPLALPVRVSGLSAPAGWPRLLPLAAVCSSISTTIHSSPSSPSTSIASPSPPPPPLFFALSVFLRFLSPAGARFPAELSHALSPLTGGSEALVSSRSRSKTLAMTSSFTSSRSFRRLRTMNCNASSSAQPPLRFAHATSPLRPPARDAMPGTSLTRHAALRCCWTLRYGSRCTSQLGAVSRSKSGRCFSNRRAWRWKRSLAFT
mmetsp:Transcript_47087/g.110981  ORF Transcript_47087/g.110981 Transcript_47087/m.110981 type:complete len:253 (-) Transcript_47087:1679-2437(-)